MRRLTPIVAAIVLALALAIASPGEAHGAGPHDAGRGFLPPNAKVHGQTLRDLAGAWASWAFGSAPDVNPLLANRCEQSPDDPRIWFLPVSLGGDYAVDCHVPYGASIVVTPAGYECSTAEGNGTTKAELRACADAGFDLITTVQLSLDGRAAKRLDRYVVTSRLYHLPGPNLYGPDPSPSLIKGYFLVIHPLSPGAHTVRAFDEFASLGFSAGITYDITVGKHPRHRHH